jgi:hypothetical protein
MSGDYEDDKWYYFWVTKNSQGMPCNPYYAMKPKPGVVEMNGLRNSMNMAIDLLDEEEANSCNDIARYHNNLIETRTITDPNDRPGLTKEEKKKLLDDYRDYKSPENYEKRRAAIKRSYEDYAKQMGYIL